MGYSSLSERPPPKGQGGAMLEVKAVKFRRAGMH
jgi:hypothetical protein